MCLLFVCPSHSVNKHPPLICSCCSTRLSVWNMDPLIEDELGEYQAASKAGIVHAKSRRRERCMRAQHFHDCGTLFFCFVLFVDCLFRKTGRSHNRVCAWRDVTRVTWRDATAAARQWVNGFWCVVVSGWLVAIIIDANIMQQLRPICGRPHPSIFILIHACPTYIYRHSQYCIRFYFDDVEQEHRLLCLFVSDWDLWLWT